MSGRKIQRGDFAVHRPPPDILVRRFLHIDIDRDYDF